MRQIDLNPGDSFGRLTVINYHSSDCQGRMYLCQCSCGKQVTVRAKRWGKTKSCRCLNTDRLLSWVHNPNRKHGLSNSSEYRSWISMRERCTSELPRFKHWKGRGINVCNGWMHSFVDFYATLGPKSPGTTLDRINTDGHYSCGKCPQCISNNWTMNCKWSTALEQAKNRRNYKGTTKSKKIENFTPEEFDTEAVRRGYPSIVQVL